MTRLTALTGALLTVGFLGCGCSQEKPPYSIRRVVLLDVQGLHGGRNLYIDSQGHGWQETVKPGEGGLQVARFEFVTTKGTMEQFARLLRQSDFFTIKTKDRFGVPDESRPTIYVETTDGRSAYIRKWDGDKHPDFDPVYSELLKWADGNERQVSSRVFDPKPFDWNWRPDGFGDIKH